MYDADEDGLLSPKEFTTLLHDMRQVRTCSSSTGLYTPCRSCVCYCCGLSHTLFLVPSPFTSLLSSFSTSQQKVHGDVDALAGRRSNPGCLGNIVALPDTDLVRSRHNSPGWGTKSAFQICIFSFCHGSFGVIDVSVFTFFFVLSLTTTP